jgi:hypothetical protein
MSTVGHAEAWGNYDWWHKREPPHPGSGGDTGGPRPAPEIDPSSASAALAMLAGGILVIRGRR